MKNIILIIIISILISSCSSSRNEIIRNTSIFSSTQSLTTSKNNIDIQKTNTATKQEYEILSPGLIKKDGIVVEATGNYYFHYKGQSNIFTFKINVTGLSVSLDNNSAVNNLSFYFPNQQIPLNLELYQTFGGAAGDGSFMIGWIYKYNESIPKSNEILYINANVTFNQVFNINRPVLISMEIIPQENEGTG